MMSIVRWAKSYCKVLIPIVCLMGGSVEAVGQIFYISGAGNPTPTSGNRDIDLYDLSRDGTTAVGSRSADSGGALIRQPFYIRNVDTSGPQLIVLGNLVQNQSTEAFTVSGNGLVAAGVAANYPFGPMVSWYLNYPYGMSNIGFYPGSVSTTAVSATDTGNMLVGYIRYPNGTNQAMRYIVGGPIENLGALAPGLVDSTAQDVSANGSVIIGSSDGAIGTKAARYVNGVWTSLGTLPGGANSYGQAVTADGRYAVGHSEFAGGGTLLHPFIHEQLTGNMVDLGVPPGGFNHAVARDVSDDARIVVGFTSIGRTGVRNASFWSDRTGPILFKDALIRHGIIPANSAMTFTEANSISGNGRIIIGNGIDGAGVPMVWRVRNFTLLPEYVSGLPASVTACPGSTTPVTLTPVFRGYGPLTYTWTHNSTPINPDSNYSFNGTSLTINNPAVAPAGSYTCKATGPYGDVIAPAVQLIKPSPIQFTGVGPTSRSLCDADDGVEFEISVAYVDGFDSDRVFRWQAQTDGFWGDIGAEIIQQSPFGSRVRIRTADLPLPARQSYPIRCVVSPAPGCAFVASPVATLTLNRPAIAAQPVHAEAAAGGSSTFTVTRVGSLLPSLQWQARTGARIPWANLSSGTNTLDGHTFIASGVNAETLTLTDVTTPNSAAFSRSLQVRAVATNSCGQSISSPASWRITNATIPWIVTNLHPTTSFVPGTEASEYSSSRITGLANGRQFGAVEFLGPFVSYPVAWSGTPASAVNFGPAAAQQFSEITAADGSFQVGTVDGQGVRWMGSASSRAPLPVPPPAQGGWSYRAAPAGTDGLSIGGSLTYEGGDSHAARWDGTAMTLTDLHPSWAYRSGVLAARGNQQVGWYQEYSGAVSDKYAALWSGSAASVVSLDHDASMVPGESEATALWNGVQGGHYFNRAVMWTGTASSRVDVAPVDAATFWPTTYPDGTSVYPPSQISAAGDGFMVGWANEGIGVPHAILWRVDTGAWEDLNLALPSGLNGSGATCVRATDCILQVGGWALQFDPVSNTSRTVAVLWTRTLGSAPPVPIITQQPVPAIMRLGQTATLSVQVAGGGGTSDPNQYQWRYRADRTSEPPLDLTDGARVVGATGPTLTLSNLQTSDGGWYDCVVSTSCQPVAATSQRTLVSVSGVPQCGLSDVSGPNQNAVPDGQLTADDIIVYIGLYFAGSPLADVAGLNQSTLPDGQLTADDIIVFLSRYFAGC